MLVNNSAMAPRTFTWNSGEKSPQYLTTAMQEGQSVSYSWKAKYIQTGEPSFQASGTGSNDVLDIQPV